MKDEDKARANAYLQGRKDCRAGKVVGDNPFDEEDAEHWYWLAGWADEKVGNAG